jgi:hypothetical protein
MLNWYDNLIQQERYQDLQREAQRDRLVKLAQQSRELSHSFYRRAFTWLGKQLVCWGLSLQAQAGSAPATLEPARQAC